MGINSRASLILYALCLTCYVLWGNWAKGEETDDDNRPYSFSFDIVDFQHRFEKKDANGIVTGEYGFITADGVYHEVGYATDEKGDFLITKMRNRKIGSLQDARDIFKDNPEAAKKLVEAVAKACSGCKIPAENDGRASTKAPLASTSRKSDSKVSPGRIKIGNKRPTEKPINRNNEILENAKDLSNSRRGKNLPEVRSQGATDFTGKLPQKGKTGELLDKKILEKMSNDIYYRFNYSLNTHGHHEDGYRSGKKDGSYRSQSENGVDAQVKYLSNEFGHQPNISFIPRNDSSKEKEDRPLKGYSFLWYWS